MSYHLVKLAAHLESLDSGSADARAIRETLNREAVLRAALESAAACFDILDPRQPSGLSDAETARVFNATREAVRLALE